MNIHNKSFMYIISVTVILLIISTMLLYFTIFTSNDGVSTFNETTVYIDSGWTLTDRDGNVSEIMLPYNVKNGVNSIETVLPDIGGLLNSPTLEIYSNYTDIDVYLDGELIYSYPEGTSYIAGTGNTYHYLRLSETAAGKTLKIVFKGQVGNGIKYLLRPVGYGARASMLGNAIREALPILAISSCMLMISIVIIALSFTYRHYGVGNSESVHLGMFTLLFAAYIILETKFSVIFLPHPQFVYTTIFILLALMSIPVFMYFVSSIKKKYHPIVYSLIVIFWLNLIVQTILHFTNTVNIRVMMPVTHLVMIISICVMIVLMILSKISVMYKMTCAFPVAIGGFIDIILLSIDKPSPNNNLFFSIGVMIFIISQFCLFILSYMKIYKESIESDFIRKVAYTDALTGLGNRASYEKALNDLEAETQKNGLCCIVADINNLKMINDNYGHTAGDTAIKQIGLTIKASLPGCLGCYRTGGDEFVAFRMNNGMSEKEIVDIIESNIEKAGNDCHLPLSIAVGCGFYDSDYISIAKFVSHVDAKMYEEKKRLKKLLNISQ